MPVAIVKIPQDTFDAEGLARLARGITAAAKQAEQIGDDPRQEFLTWVLIDEVPAGRFFTGGQEPPRGVIPVLVTINVPAGVLNGASRSAMVRGVHEAAQEARSNGDQRQVASSVIVSDVADGTWGGDGTVWHLPDFARAGGYQHLQHLVR